MNELPSVPSIDLHPVHNAHQRWSLDSQSLPWLWRNHGNVQGKLWTRKPTGRQFWKHTASPFCFRKYRDTIMNQWPAQILILNSCFMLCQDKKLIISSRFSMWKPPCWQMIFFGNGNDRLPMATYIFWWFECLQYDESPTWITNTEPSTEIAWNTPWKINTEPQNHAIEQEIIFQILMFGFQANFPRCMIQYPVVLVVKAYPSLPNHFTPTCTSILLLITFRGGCVPSILILLKRPPERADSCQMR